MKFIIPTVAFVTLLGIIGSEDYNGAAADHRHHCEMVALWEKSGGENGHPNYDQRECSVN